MIKTAVVTEGLSIDFDFQTITIALSEHDFKAVLDAKLTVCGTIVTFTEPIKDPIAENNCDHEVYNGMCIRCGYRWDR